MFAKSFPSHVVNPAKKLKFIDELVKLFEVVSYISRNVKGFATVGLPSVLISFMIRGFANGFIIPYSISSIVEGLRSYFEDVERDSQLVIGLAGVGVSGAIFAVSELVLFLYFKKLSRSIVVLKEKALSTLSPEDQSVSQNRDEIVGVVANDIDFVIWNVNGVLTALLPNFFSTITAIMAVHGLASSMTPYVSITMIPYIIYTEFYIRAVEYQRYMEREVYGYSIIFIRDYFYERKEKTDIGRVLERWRFHVDRILWYDRLFFTAGLGTSFGSTAILSYIVAQQAFQGRISLGGVAGLISAMLTAHLSMLNTVWALCVQGQVVAAYKRILKYVNNLGIEKNQVLAYRK